MNILFESSYKPVGSELLCLPRDTYLLERYLFHTLMTHQQTIVNDSEYLLMYRKGLGDQGQRVSCQSCLWNHPKCRQKIVACTSKKLSSEQVAKKWGWATSEWWSPKRSKIFLSYSPIISRYSTTTWDSTPHGCLLFSPRFPKQCHVVLLWGSICWCFLLLLIDLADLPDSDTSTWGLNNSLKH